jgi:uncharacterized protein YqeY
MPLNSQRVLAIIMEECKERDERFPGYHKELRETLAEILQLERDHRVQGTNIKQRVTDKIGALGRLIADSQRKHN